MVSASVLAFVCVEACPVAPLTYARRRLDSRHDGANGPHFVVQQEISAKIASAMHSVLPTHPDPHDADTDADTAVVAGGGGVNFALALNESYIAP